MIREVTIMRNTQRTAAVLGILVSCFLAMVGQVFAGDYRYPSGVAVEVISDDRGVLAKYAAGGEYGNVQRNYVIARDNERYRIRVRNLSNQRVGLVIAVDGRNIISGKKSYLAADERMYILSPYGTGEYEGWRTGKNRVNRFYFTGMSDSYAAAWGDYSAMGVIAVAVYKSRHDQIYGHRNDKGPKSFNQPNTKGKRQDPGTGFGESRWSPSVTVQFTPESRPVEKQFIKYEWRSTLCRRGVIRCRNIRTHSGGNRFWPESSYEGEYAPFPGSIPRYSR